MAKTSNNKDREIWEALNWHPEGYYYYKVDTSTRRNGRMKISQSKYNKLKAIYGKQER